MDRLIVLALLWAASCVAEDVDITFTVVPKTLPTNSTVFITGNHEKLGVWDAGAVALEKREDGSWSQAFKFPAGTELEYKVTRGSWQTEAVSAEGVVPKNFKLHVLSNESVRIVVANWRDAVHKLEGQITGTVRYHPKMEGEGIKPRDIIVWLP